MDFIWGNLFMGSLWIMMGGAILSLNDPNPNIGYNMPSELKNKDMKIEANKYSGKVMVIAGLLSVFLGIILNLLITTDNFTEDKLMGINIATLMITSTIVGLTTISLTEIYLGKVFDKKGIRRKQD